MKLNRYYWLIILSVMLGSTAFSGCSGSSAATPTTTTDQQSAIMADLPERILAEARVVPQQSAALSFSTPGIVEEVLVDEGKQVEAGGAIARLKGIKRAEASIAQAEVLLLSAQKELDDLLDQSMVTTANAELALASAQIAYNNALEDRESLDYQQVSDNTLDGIRANYYLAEDAFKTAQKDYEQYKDRKDTDLDRAFYLNKLAAARAARDKALYNLNKALERPEPDKVAQADAALSLTKAALDDAQKTYEKLKAGPDPDVLKIKEANLKNAQAQLEYAQASLNDLNLTAPFSGTVITNSLKVGQAVSPADMVMLGDVSSWKIETTDLTELDITGISVGDSVSITFDAIPDLELTGVVNRIKAFGENKQGDITYTVYIDLDQQDPRLLWNMKAFVSFEVTN